MGEPHPSPEAVVPPFPLSFAAGLVEDQEVVFVYEGAWEPAAVPRLLAGEVELEASLRGGRLCWRWSPDFHAGEVRLTLVRGNERQSRVVEIDANRAKLTRDEYAALVADVARRTRRLHALSSVEVPVRRAAAEPITLAQIQFLRAACERLAHAVREIARSPRKRLRGVQVTTPLALADNVIPDALAALVVPENLIAVPVGRNLAEGVLALAMRLNGHLPRTAVTEERAVTFDVPENRFVKHTLEAITALLWRASRELGVAATARDAGTAGDVARAYLPIIDRMRREVFDLLRLPFLAEVRAEVVEELAFVTFKRRPDYRTVADVHRDLLVAFEPLNGSPLSVPVERTHRLYELWTTLEIVLALADRFGDDRQDLGHLMTWLGDDTSLSKPHDEPLLVSISTRVTVGLQRSFAGSSSSAGIATYSHEMRPDLVVEVSPATRERSVLLIFDAKYRTADGLRSGFNDLHRYKDALVAPDLRRVVLGAYAVAPGRGSLSAAFEDPAWQDRHGFGIVTARPGDSSWTARVCEIVENAITGEATARTASSPSS